MAPVIAFPKFPEARTPTPAQRVPPVATAPARSILRRKAAEKPMLRAMHLVRNVPRLTGVKRVRLSAFG